MIEIGSQKQLLLDDHLIESMTGVNRVLNPATGAEMETFTPCKGSASS